MSRQKVALQTKQVTALNKGSAKPLFGGSIPPRASNFTCASGNMWRSLSRYAGSGFRLRALASLTPAKRLKFDSAPRLHLFCGNPFLTSSTYFLRDERSNHRFGRRITPHRV